MSYTVANVLDRARGIARDKKNSNYVREFLTEQANGLNTTLQARNRNLLQTADGAPSDVKLFIGGSPTPTAITALDQNAGLLTIAAAPAIGQQLDVRYYFSMATDAEWLDFYRTAAGMVGATLEIAATTDPISYPPGYIPAVTLYAAAQSARSLASLTHWYYSANAGNKSFNKDQISKKFMEQAKEWEDEARKLRLDVNDRFDQNKAPAFAYAATRGVAYWEPPR